MKLFSVFENNAEVNNAPCGAPLPDKPVNYALIAPSYGTDNNGIDLHGTPVIGRRGQGEVGGETGIGRPGSEQEDHSA